jgi:NADH-quinone oxidoreductase subunit N
MDDPININIFVAGTSAVLCLILESLGRKQSKISTRKKPHIRLIAFSTCIFIIGYQLKIIPITQLVNSSSLLGMVFLSINTFAAMFLATKSLKSFQNGEIYFYILSALALALLSIISSDLAIIALVSIAWLSLMLGLATVTSNGSKAAEIGTKLGVSIGIIILLFFLAIFISVSTLGTSTFINMSKAVAQNPLHTKAIFFLVIASLFAVSGIAPFQTAAVDTAFGSNTAISYLLITNGTILGSVHVEKFIKLQNFNSSPLQGFNEYIIIWLLLALTLLWLRALDQQKIERAITYIAFTQGPLFILCLLLGSAISIPRSLYLLSLFSCLTLSSFCLFYAQSLMNFSKTFSLTWEEIAGIGRLNKAAAMCWLIAIASITGLPGTLGYFLKLSLISPLKHSPLYVVAIFLSIAFGAACTLRLFVFLFAKHPHSIKKPNTKPKFAAALIFFASLLIIAGFFPFVG